MEMYYFLYCFSCILILYYISTHIITSDHPSLTVLYFFDPLNFLRRHNKKNCKEKQNKKQKLQISFN